MLDGVGRILPRQVVAVRLSHQAGIVALATIGNERLVHFVHLIIFLAGSQLAYHLLEHGVALCRLTERVVINGLRIQQVVLQGFVTRQVGLIVHHVQMFLGRLCAVHLHIHIETLLRYPIVTVSAVGRIHTRSADNLVGTAQQVESLLPVVLTIVHGRGLRGTLRSQFDLASVGIVVEGMDVRGTCLGNVFLRVNTLSLLMQRALLDILGHCRNRAEEQAHK